MNILIVDDKTELATGKKISRLFPSGSYEFIISSEQAIGCYQSCSLYSPMFAFEQQSVAVETAKEALRYLLLAPEQPGLSRRDLLRGQFSRRNGVD
jgi:[NiFe] hydrogenase assembly HybE family chaperone